MAVDATRLWVFRFLTLWFCETVLHMGVRSVWYSVVISNGISSVVLFILYKSKLWKKPRIKVGSDEADKQAKQQEKTGARLVEAKARA